MSKLLGILTQDNKSIKEEDAQLEVAQQNVNLQSFAVNTTREISQLKASRNKALRAGGAGMWSAIVDIDQKIENLEKTQSRLVAYNAEFIAEG